MKVVRVFNNNVVLAVRNDGQEVILTGRGVGFQTKPGCEVASAKVTRTFVPESGRDSDYLAQMVAAIEPEFLVLADRALARVSGELAAPASAATIVALADHLAFAVQRAQTGELLGPHPLQAEVTHLYPAEFAAAGRIIDFVAAEQDTTLPDAETVAVTLHLVNAGFRTDDLSETYLMTGVFSQLFEIIDSTFDITVDRSSLSAARFITHLR